MMMEDVVVLGCEDKFYCEDCDKEFRRSKNYQAHMASYHVGTCERYTCEFCPKSFPKNNGLQLHVKWAHASGQRLQCKLCHASFINSARYRSHMTNKHGVQQGYINYKCTHCSEVFRSQDLLDTHILSHRVTVDYKCALCGRKFISRHLLVGHLQRKCLHDNEASDGQLVAVESQLVVSQTHRNQFGDHMESGGHTNATLENVVIYSADYYMCSLCDAKCDDHESMTHHLRTTCPSGDALPCQNDDKRECAVCGLMSATLDDHNDHTVTHFTCHLCKNKNYFKCLDNMRRHFQTAHEYRPCYACHKIFGTLEALREHFSDDHKNNFSDHKNISSDHKNISGDHKNISGDHKNMSSDHKNMSSDHKNMSSDHKSTTKEVALEAINLSSATGRKRASKQQIMEYAFKKWPWHYPLMSKEDLTVWQQELEEVLVEDFEAVPFKEQTFYKQKSSPVREAQVTTTILGMCSVCQALFTDTDQLEMHVKSRECIETAQIMAAIKSIHNASTVKQTVNSPNVNHCTGDKEEVEQIVGKKVALKNNKTNKVTPVAVKKNWHQCKVCSLTFNWKVDLRHHIRAKHPEQFDFRCKDCHKTFVSSAFLKRHSSAQMCPKAVLTLVWRDEDDEEDSDTVL